MLDYNPPKVGDVWSLINGKSARLVVVTKINTDGWIVIQYLKDNKKFNGTLPLEIFMNGYELFYRRDTDDRL